MAGQDEEHGGGTPASAKKRLLPMELRRRRRAAKLQITAERNVATISATDMLKDLDEQETETQLPPETTVALTIEAEATSVQPTVQEPSPQRPPPVTVNATAKLQSLLSRSLLDRKRQRSSIRDVQAELPMAMQAAVFPLDVAPKSKIVVTMSFPFPFLRPRSTPMATAMATASAQQLPSTDPEIRWLQATHYYVHPASPLPPSLSVTNDKQLEESEFYVQRFCTWQESFRHAYFGFRRQSSQTLLYLRCSEFVACFYRAVPDANDTRRASTSLADLCREYQGQGTTDDEDKSATSRSKSRLCAVVSQSNARMRKELLARNIVYNVPFNLKAMQKPVNDMSMLDEEDHALHAQTFAPSASSVPSVHGPDSLLLFDGHQSVHGLYEYLLNRKPLSNQDVPEVIASYPFSNAAICPLSVRYMGRTATTISSKLEAPSTSDPADATNFRIEITGFCSAPAIASLLDSLREGRQGSSDSIKIVMETASMAERLNAVFLKAKDPLTLQRSSQERDEWKKELEIAKRRLQAVVCAIDETKLELDMAR
ncbi:hypothetical protein Poli38472_002430 [Pythium oligandrum]|uniref:Uncharacterized protein n=1 Tax=Pythium oligandrum TaxID=41045 RepID=A0A8K1CH61_PYTOL|nr:hypothetical protein Poli38472_002430 [Pythium oligandrum]|eukprot:TMW63489.1 hypothetical protein Poli38472_002430 [Pythium oligandrum]